MVAMAAKCPTALVILKLDHPLRAHSVPQRIFYFSLSLAWQMMLRLRGDLGAAQAARAKVRGQQAATPALANAASFAKPGPCYNQQMHWLIKLVLVIGGNAFALWLANRWISGFVLTTPILGLILLGLTLTILNFILKPILTLALGPIIIITLGLGLIVVNAIILWFAAYLSNLPQLDFIHGSITIQSIPALILATLIISVVNFIIHLVG